MGKWRGDDEDEDDEEICKGQASSIERLGTQAGVLNFIVIFALLTSTTLTENVLVL